MLIFGLRSTSDDLPSNPSNEVCPKCEKMVTKSSKNEMLIFGLHSTSDDRLSNPSNKTFLWQFWYDQNLMYPPPPKLKVENLAKKFWGRFGMIKIQCTPPPK